MFALGMPWSWKLAAFCCLWFTPHYLTIPSHALLHDVLQLVVQVVILSTLLPASLHSVGNRDKTNTFIISCVIMHSLVLVLHYAAKFSTQIAGIVLVGHDHVLMLKLHTTYCVARTLSKHPRLVPFNSVFCFLHYTLAVGLLLIIAVRQECTASMPSAAHVLGLFFVGEVFGVMVQLVTKIILITSEQYENYFQCNGDML